ncbi:MAG: hypothetical protein KIS86_16030 [Devosia sp.]|nr:hypothetical protein [Devosia sp.]
MTISRHDTFRPISQILAAKVLPALYRSQRLPLRVFCLGTTAHHDGDDAAGIDRTADLGKCPSPEDAMHLASLHVARGDIQRGLARAQRFRPRIAVIQDREYGLVLAGEIRANAILWQQPVASNAEARRIVTEASRLRGMAFAASGRGDHGSARDLRFRASLCEARLVDPFWRETAAELLQLPQAA